MSTVVFSPLAAPSTLSRVAEPRPGSSRGLRSRSRRGVPAALVGGIGAG